MTKFVYDPREAEGLAASPVSVVESLQGELDKRVKVFGRIAELERELGKYRRKLQACEELSDDEMTARSLALGELQELERQYNPNRQKRAGDSTRDQVLHEAARTTRFVDSEERQRIHSEQAIKARLEAVKQAVAHAAARPERWRALSKEARAAFRAAEQRSLREAFFAFAKELAADGPTEPARSFEPEYLPENIAARMQPFETEAAMSWPGMS